VETASTASSESGGALPAVQKAVAAVASAFARVLTGGADAKPAASPSRRGTAGDAASTSSDDTLGDLDVPDAAVAVLSLSPPGADESTANLPPPASGKLRHLRALRQFSTVPDAAAAWPERPRHVWVDVATTAPEDVKLLAVVGAAASPRDGAPRPRTFNDSAVALAVVVPVAAQRWGLRDDTVRHILHPSHHDELQLHAAYLELRINLTARPEMDDDDDYAQVVTFLVTNDALISFHQPECESVRAVLAQNQVVLLPPREDPALASVSGALDVVAAPPTPASHALSAASSVSGAPTGGSDGAAAAPPPPVAAAPVAATLRPDQLLCEVLYSFVRDCANVMQRHDDEIEELHELMLVLAENERSDYLRRITLSRSDLMAMRRHLAIKRALLRNLLVGRPSLFITADAYPYLRYIFEQVDYYARAVSMAKDALNQVQANYLAKLNVDMADVAQRTNDNVKVFTIVATLSLPVNMVSGIMGMNVWYPGTPAVGGEGHREAGARATRCDLLAGLMQGGRRARWQAASKTTRRSGRSSRRSRSSSGASSSWHSSCGGWVCSRAATSSWLCTVV